MFHCSKNSPGCSGKPTARNGIRGEGRAMVCARGLATEHGKEDDEEKGDALQGV